ncbi:DNA-directed RNA polymerase subunit H [Candidatus Bilamarchaeum dharawalense]|uniref:DNA-directed RNA polymerase subunit H n=1 Tax=Candidatus Bilamarchaeum dharawalense TaxID=2885759 RepID=A0A5E4LR68_9ARCH|nr:DNA-directed RNA polymerase subunit H [Candidatus Bilamarchaeum dharawalense]
MLVPEMKVLSDAEKTKVLSKYRINEHQLPKMYSKDPAAVALKATAGNLIKVERNDGTGKYTTYRIVVE